MSWFKATITESCLLGGAFHRLCREFQRAFIAAGAPSEMALFAETFVLGNNREIYFSPGSMPHVAELVQTYEGRPCAPPDLSDLTMVYGVPGGNFSTDALPVAETATNSGFRGVSVAR